jgi:hypothetical protein
MSNLWILCDFGVSGHWVAKHHREIEDVRPNRRYGGAPGANKGKLVIATRTAVNLPSGLECMGDLHLIYKTVSLKLSHSSRISNSKARLLSDLATSP